MFASWALAYPLLVSLLSGQQQLPPPTFRGRVDVVTVDVRVLGPDDAPVGNLGLEDFTITVDGRPRKAVAVDFLAFDAPTGAPPGTDRRDPRFSSGTRPIESGRTLLLVVDEANIRPGDSALAVDAALSFVDRLGPSDRVGLLTIPVTSGRVEPSTDRPALREALKRITGRLVPVETLIAQELTIGAAESFALTYDPKQWADIVVRECVEKGKGDPEDGKEGQPLPDCVSEIEHAARTLAADVRQRMMASTRALAAVVKGMSRVPGPKTIVFVSQELPVPPWLQERREFETEAAQIERAAGDAQTSVFVLHLHRPPFDVGRRLANSTLSADNEMAGYGLETITSLAGGRRLMVAGSAVPAFERIAREISGFYAIGFEAEASDRDGRPHNVEVKVKRPGLSVRGRRSFSFAEAGQRALADLVAAARGTVPPGTTPGGSTRAETDPAAIPEAGDSAAVSAYYWALVQDFRQGNAMTALEKLAQLDEPRARRAVSAIRGEIRSGELARWSPANVRAASLFHLELVLRDLPRVPWGRNSQLFLSRELLAVARELERQGEPATFRKQWRLAVVWWLQGHFEMTDAAAELQRMKDDFPDDPEVLLTEATLHETYAWPNLGESVPRPMVGFANAREVRGHLSQAESMFRKVLELQPANVEARVRLAQVLRQQKREKEALDLLADAVTKTDDAWLAYQARLLSGAAAEAVGNPTLAVEHYRAAVQLQPKAPTGMIALSHALRSTGDRTQALATAFQVQQAGGSDPWWEYFCGQYRKLPSRIDEMRREVMR